jgi:hypothetical protein
LTGDHNKLGHVKKDCKEIISYIHDKVDPSFEYYKEKNGTDNDDEIKYFSWAEGGKIILKLRK